MKAIASGGRTIRSQLTWRLLITFGVPLLVAGIGGYLVIRASLLGRLDASLLTKAEAIVSASTWENGQLHIDTSAPFMREFAAIESISAAQDEGIAAGGRVPPALRASSGFFEVREAERGVLARSRSFSLAGADERFEAALARSPVATGRVEQPVFWMMPLPSGIAGRALAFPFVPRIPHEGGVDGPIAAVLIVVVDREDLDRTLSTVAAVLSAAGVLLAVTIVLSIAMGLRRALAPLDGLADQASRVDARSLERRFATSGLPGELVPIATRLNDLLSRLEQSFERERQFSADVAHELRTPIAELRAGAELSLKWPDARPADADRDTLTIATHMDGMVSRLLDLLRSERGHLPIAREPIAIGEMVDSVWKSFSVRAAEKTLSVTIDINAAVVIDTDRWLLRSILTNVIENAVDYTPPHGTVRIELASGEPFSLRIANTTEMLTTDDVSRLFDRFWRHDAARTGTEHSGLGLSLSRAFARALDYDLTANLDPDTGLLTLTLTLAARSSDAA